MMILNDLPDESIERIKSVYGFYKKELYDDECKVDFIIYSNTLAFHVWLGEHIFQNVPYTIFQLLPSVKCTKHVLEHWGFIYAECRCILKKYSNADVKTEFEVGGQIMDMLDKSAYEMFKRIETGTDLPYISLLRPKTHIAQIVVLYKTQKIGIEIIKE